MANMKEQDALGLAEKMLTEGENPLKILELCREAVEIIGKQFEQGNYFLPELILAGEMMKEISKI
jgi:5-methyltetrahydrofolate--homocysteine methyltransferase